MEEQKRKNPWLGLESYREGEVLYGRDDDIRDLTQSVLNDTDTLLYGKSGIGKSSILNAGVIPAARRHGYLPVLVRLSHKEQHSYLYQIKNAIANAMIPFPADASGNHIALSPEEQRTRESKLASRIRKVVECKDPEKESLYEFFHRYTFQADNGERIKLLIIFDQFEEIFTLQADEAKKKRFFAELADFLNDIMPSELQHEVVNKSDVQEEVKVVDSTNLDDLFNELDLGIDNDIPEYVTDNDIHMVFTIREDFLSEFEYYSAAIPSLKQNRYGLRPINEEQAAQIILRPMPGLINKDVAKLIIEKVTGHTDFELNGIPELEVDSAVLSLYLNRLYDANTSEKITAELVEHKGGEIISDFYNDAISGISEPTIEYLEDMLLNGQGRRDNITVFDAINDGGATEEELDILCNKKKILRQFNYAGDLRIEYVHDILCPVVKEHKDERLLLKQQEQARLRQEEEKKKLLLEEKAKREKIEKKAEEEKARLRAAAIRSRKRNRRRLIAVGSFMLLFALGIAYYWWEYKWEFKTSYASFTTKRGWPEGIGKELSDNDKKQMPVYYQLVRYGYRSKNSRVNILNSQKKLTRNKFIESPLVGLYETEGQDEKAKEFAILQRKTAYWIYIPDNDGNLLRKTAYDPEGNVLYAIQFFRSTAVSDDNGNEDGKMQKKQLWANYVDKFGKAMRIRDNGADRMRIIVNESTGYHEGYHFYSETGTPQPNHAGAYGYRYQLADDGEIIKKTPVDAFGDYRDDAATIYESFDEYGRWTKVTGGQAEYSKDLVVYSINNRKDSLRFGDQGELLYHSETKSDGEFRRFHYQKGQVVMTHHYRKANGNGIELAYSREIIPNKDGNVRETQVYWADSTIRYRIKREERKPGQLTIAYYGGDSPSSINKPFTVSMPEGRYHKLVSDTTREDGLVKVTNRYIDTNGDLSPSCEYNSEVSYYNDNDERLKRIVYKDGQRIYGYINEYEDGQITAQSVVGIDDNTPIRYAGWEKNHWCYYKMKLVYNFSNTLVAVKGINEFGEESLIVTEDDENYMATIVPSTEMSAIVHEDDGSRADVYGTQVYKVQFPRINKARKVDYIHILDKGGAWYQAGIRDGDLLVKDGNPMRIARPNKDKKTYDILMISVKNGPSGGEHYPVYFTEREMERYNNAISLGK